MTEDGRALLIARGIELLIERVEALPASPDRDFALLGLGAAAAALDRILDGA